GEHHVQRQDDHGLPLRLRPPAARDPADGPPLPGRAAEARRAGVRDLPARGLPAGAGRAARGQARPRRAHVLVTLPAELTKLAARVSNWGRWGDDDELGCGNLLTDAAARRGAEQVRSGRRVSLAAPLRADGI